jgi:hypothetical protein
MISEAQLNVFREVNDVTADAPDLESESDNFRALQPLNERRLLDVDTGDGTGDATPTATLPTSLMVVALSSLALSSSKLSL